MRRNVSANIDGLLPKPPAKLGDVGHCRVIELPQSIFVEGLDALAKPDFDAVRQKIILTQQVLLLNASKQLRVVTFPHRHDDYGIRRMDSDAFLTLSFVMY
jgi:hypothetical protein